MRQYRPALLSQRGQSSVFKRCVQSRAGQNYLVEQLFDVLTKLT
jgi:hypothetical protein